MKQIGLAVEQYKNDFDGYTLPAEQDLNGATSGGLRSWPSLIFAYVKSDQVFVCPSTQPVKAPADVNFLPTASAWNYCGQTNALTSTGGNAGDGSNNGTLEGGTASTVGTPTRLVNALSYGMNFIPDAPAAWNNGNWGVYTFNGATMVYDPTPGNESKNGFVGKGTTQPLNESQVEDASGTIRMVDAMTGTSSASDPCTFGNSIRGIQALDRTDYRNGPFASKVSYRHFDGMNILFADGHVKWRKWGTTKPEDWSMQAD